MINNSFKEYLENEHNKEKNYKEILSKEKGVVSMKRKFLNIAAMFVVIVIAGVLSTQIYAKIKWNIEFKEYQYRPSAEATGTLGETGESDYAEVLDMDYLTQDGIGVKIDSILLTDDCLDINLTFKFDESIEVNSSNFMFGYAIYDENRNIYNIVSRTHIGSAEKYDNTTLFIYKELGVKYDKKDVYAIQLAESSGLGPIEANTENRTIKENINIRAKDKFPQSKKLYIQIFDPGFSMVELGNKNNKPSLENAEDFKLSEAKWNLEIAVPDKFYERNTIELKPKNDIPGIEFESITISETGMTLKFKSEEYINLIEEGMKMQSNDFREKINNLLNITDGEGNKYNELSSGTTSDDMCKITIDASIRDLDKKLYINYNNNGTQYKEELIEK